MVGISYVITVTFCGYEYRDLVEKYYKHMLVTLPRSLNVTFDLSRFERVSSLQADIHLA
jgi:hypothetical protein